MNITSMLKKYHEIKWTIEERRYFTYIKISITEAPVLVIPNFTKYFLIFFYASDHTIIGVLLQKNSQGVEHPIDFFSKVLRDEELNYDIMDKHEYDLFMSLKDFRFYILMSHIIFDVPSNVVKDILTHPDPQGNITKWIVVLLEYEIEINPTKFIKG